MLVERYYAEMYIVRAQNESQFWWGGEKLSRGCDTCVCILKDSIRQKVFWEGNVWLGQVKGEALAKVWLYGPVWHNCYCCGVGVLNCSVRWCVVGWGNMVSGTHYMLQVFEGKNGCRRQRPHPGGTCMPCCEARVCPEMSLRSVFTNQKSDVIRSDLVEKHPSGSIGRRE